MIARGPGGLANRVYPSGSDLNTISAPIFPPAPVLFSTMMPDGHFLANFSDKTRGRISAVPPAGKGTTILTVLFGYVEFCANVVGLLKPNRARVKV